jgi:xylose isomerase
MRYGVNFHDDDLVPPGSSASQREAIVKWFRRTLDQTGMRVPMATTNLPRVSRSSRPAACVAP